MANKNKLRAVCYTAIMGAIGFVFMLLEFPVPFMPYFIQFDISELPALITSFAFGPVYGILTCLIKNLLHLFVTKTNGVGELSNFLLGAVFCLFVGSFYKYKKTRANALIATVIGSLLMAIAAIPLNLYIVYPLYIRVCGFPLEQILGAYTAIIKSADSLIKALVIFNLPFTFFKGIIDSIICFVIYKRISPILKTGIKHQ